MAEMDTDDKGYTITYDPVKVSIIIIDSTLLWLLAYLIIYRLVIIMRCLQCLKYRNRYLFIQRFLDDLILH